mmetsp:Transcript_46753/g.96581  ORF Transcript_46753/g.96581 Transcript_46753/m.96581 type:complete len:134 (-) Transcript_46753:324-725(-)
MSQSSFLTGPAAGGRSETYRKVSSRRIRRLLEAPELGPDDPSFSTGAAVTCWLETREAHEERHEREDGVRVLLPPQLRAAPLRPLRELLVEPRLGSFLLRSVFVRTHAGTWLGTNCWKPSMAELVVPLQVCGL